jgi:hypothetical protein
MGTAEKAAIFDGKMTWRGASPKELPGANGEAPVREGLGPRFG